MNTLSAQQTPKEIASILSKLERDYQQYDNGADTVYLNISRQIEAQRGNPANEAVWHSCMASFLGNYYQENRYRILERTPVEGAVPADLNVWDLQTLVKQIVYHYQQSLRNEDFLKRIPIRDWAPLLDSVISEPYRPTLYDFLAFRALDFLSRRISEMPIPINPFDINNGKYWSDNEIFNNIIISSPDEYSFSYLSLKIMQTLTRLHLRDEDPHALLDVTLRRFDYLSTTGNKENASASHLKELLKLEEQYRNQPGHEMVAYQLGNYYQNRGNSNNKDEHPEYANDYITAIEWFQTAIQDDSKSLEGRNASVKISEIQKSIIRFSVMETMPVGEPNLINFIYKDSRNIYFRIIPVTKSEYSQIMRSRNAYAELISKKQVYESSIPVPEVKDHRQRSGHFLLPPLKQGTYVLLASNAPFSANSKGDFTYEKVTITNLAADWRNNGLHYEFFVTDRVTGNPIDGAPITLSTYSDYNFKNQLCQYKLTTNKNGRCEHTFTIKEAGRLRAKLQKSGEEITLFENRWMDGDQLESREELQTYIFTDRTIYRPGQTVYYKGIIVKNSTSGYYNTVSHGVAANESELVILKDANWQDVAKEEKTTNEHGSFSGSFTLPTSGLNGTFRIKCKHGSTSIQVEEYKRPTFEVEMAQPKEQFRTDQEVEVSGTVKAYAGYAIGGATVKYHVERTASFPWWRCWWWFPSSPAQEIASGEVTTDEDGTFRIQFTAMPDLEAQRHNPLYRFKVTVDVTDITGETHSANATVLVSNTSLIIESNLPRQLELSEKNAFSVKATNLAGEPQKTTLHYEIGLLQTPAEYLNECPSHDYYLSDSETMLKALPYLDLENKRNMENWEGDLVSSGDFEADGKTLFSIPNLENLAEGTYIITFTTRDHDRNEIVKDSYITIYNKNSKKSVQYEPLWIHQEKTDVNEVGQTIHITVESYLKNARVLCEITSNDRLVESKWVTLNRGKANFSYTLTEKDLGTVSFHAFTIQNNHEFEQSLSINVPYSHQKIDFDFLTFRDKTEPGSAEQYQIRLKDKDGDKVAAELLCSMYDASLDALASPNSFAQTIFHHRSPSFRTSLTGAIKDGFSITYSESLANTRPKEIKKRNYPHLRFLMYHYYGFGTGGGRLYKTAGAPHQEGVVLNMVESSADMEVFEDDVVAEVEVEEAVPTYAAKENLTHQWEAPAEPKEEEVQMRTNFAETAFFFPDLRTDKEGNVLITFTMPESLTKWKLLGFAHNTDLMSGAFEKYVQTSKKLMVVPNVPRFLREGDTLILSAKVVNMDSVTQCGNVTLSFRNPFNNADLQIVEGATVQPFEVKPGQSQEVHFRVVVPQNLGAVTCRIVARNLETPAFSDGEERTLPVLTNRILITESLPLHISGKGSKTFRFDRLEKSFLPTASSTLTTQSLTLEFTPNPIWYAIQAMPYLMEYPYECNEQIFSRYYANTLATNIVNSHPRVKQVFDEWLNATPDAFCSQLEKNQELKSVLLEETPWVLDAQRESSRKQNVALLFDLHRMAKEGKNACKKLEDRQNNDGGWSWFASGQSNSYITEHIVAGIGHLNALGVKSALKSNTLKKAISFIDREMYDYYQRWQKKEHSSSWGDIHYLYARSFFLDQKVNSTHLEAYNLNYNNIKKNWKSQSIYMQGMIALVCYRNGDTQLAKQIIAHIKSMAQYNEEMGMFWKKSGYGWFWYEAPIERQALLIEAFNTITHDTESVEKMQLWLLKQKQTQSWPTTKSTTEAIYALLLNNTQLENTNGVTLSLGNQWTYTEGDGTEQAEAGTGYIKKSWKGGDVTADMANLKIEKQTSGPAWGGLYWQYLENLDKVEHSQDGNFSIQKQLYKVEIGERGEVLTAITEQSPLKAGDKVRVRVEIRTDRDMEYVHLKDMRAACFEPTNVLSGYRHQDGLWYYECTKDASTNFFIDYLPKGTYVFEYTLAATMTGTYSNGLTTIQCMYAPEFTSHSEGIRVTVSGE